MVYKIPNHTYHACGIYIYHACGIYMLLFLTIFSIISLKTPNFFGMPFGLFGANSGFGMRSDQKHTGRISLNFFYR